MDGLTPGLGSHPLETPWTGIIFLDLDPAVGDTLKDQLGIAEDYFSAAPIQPTPAGLEEIRASLRRICRRPRAWGGDVVEGPDTTVSEA